MSMSMLYEAEAPLEPLLDRTVAVLGYGNQGHAHALNLRDSGVRVLVGSRPESANGLKAREHEFETLSIADATRRADLVILALPDEAQSAVFEREIAPHLRAGQALGFIHGMAVHFGLLTPPENVDVVMVAPKGPGTALRDRYVAGGGLPCLVAVAHDATSRARSLALAWATGIGSGRGGILETTFERECVTDLFGEQAVLCGGLTALMKAGVETLVEAGYPPEMAYFECVHEAKLIVDLIYERGFSGMWQRVSNTAQLGGLTRGPRLIDESVKRRMREVLEDVRSGRFAEELRQEQARGLERMHRLYEQEQSHIAETAGRRVRAMMPWLGRADGQAGGAGT